MAEPISRLCQLHPTVVLYTKGGKRLTRPANPDRDQAWANGDGYSATRTYPVRAVAIALVALLVIMIIIA